MMARNMPYETYAILQQLVREARWLPEVGRFSIEEYDFIMQRIKADKADARSVGDYIVRITCPLLVIFGELDTIVDVAESVAFYGEALPQAGNLDVTVKI